MDTAATGQQVNHSKEYLSAQIKYAGLLSEFPEGHELHGIVQGIIGSEADFETTRTRLKHYKKDCFKVLNAHRAEMRRKQKYETSTVTFVAPGKPSGEILNRYGKQLSYQCQLLIDMFIPEEFSANEEIIYTNKAIREKLENWPCEGNKMAGFNYFRLKHLRPLGIIK